jgi:hypothetical protein
LGAGLLTPLQKTYHRLMPRYSVTFIDNLLTSDNPPRLAELSSIVCGTDKFEASSPDYGLPPIAFLFVEGLLWMSQALRSGVWTYYEATPISRQNALRGALRQFAPAAYGDWYERGMIDWKDEVRIEQVDKWMEANEAGFLEWLRELLVANREVVISLTD